MYLIQTSCNIIKVGVVGDINFLPNYKNCLKNESRILKNKKNWVLTGGFESNLQGLISFKSLNELLLINDAVIINDLFHSNYQELLHIIKHCKHVFINQSFPLTNIELSTLHNLAQEAEVVIQMGLEHRFNPIFKNIQKKEIKPRIIETNHFCKYKRRSTHLSIISDILLEDLDIILSKVNSEIRNISANGVGVIYNDPDIINIRIEFQNACTATISGSKIAIKDIHKTRFYQNDSYFTLDHLNNSIKVFNSNNDTYWENTDESDTLSESIETFDKPDQTNLITEQLTDFFEAVERKTNSKASLIDQLAIKFVADKIYDQLERNFVAKCS
ncbi:MAG: hypothetical protein IT243_07755 [Bacteroidia bacterium]|nr:hypothetical protein [Bacteroidia bacterium]